MFPFIKKKPALKDLIPPHHVDIHSHLLPAIDDGAKTPEDSLVLLNGLRKMGFEQFVTTPHIMKNVWDNDRDTIESALRETHVFLESNHLEVPLKAAAEYLLDGNFMESMKSEKLLTVKENYVLVEMSYTNPPIQLYDIIFELQLAGYLPILAHPERYNFYHSNFKEYEKLRNSGCVFQLNLLSVVGYYGENVANAAQSLLKKGLINFVGSDVHHTNHLKAFDKKIILKDRKPLEEAIANNQFFRF